MDSNRMDLANYLKNLPDHSLLNGVNILIEAGMEITAYTDNAVANQYGKTNLFYYHDIRKMYIKWRAIARKLLDKNKKHVLDELEIFNETDSISSVPLHTEEADFPNIQGDRELENVNKEVREKLKILRSLRGKVKKYELQDESVDPETISFDTEKSLLFVKGRLIKITKFSNQYHTLKIIFENQDEIGKEWFFSEIMEKTDSINSNEKRYYNAIYQVRLKMKCVGLNDFFIITSHSLKIREKYLS
jgi:hypothetical protein